nr:uncharacterized protein LOC119162152 [Rhipicephalus microplus]
MPRLLTQDTASKVSRLSSAYRGPSPVVPANGMDEVRLLSTSHSGNECIFVATDYPAHYTERLPIDKAQFFIENIVLHDGAPEVLFTDRGTVLTVDVTEVILKYSQIGLRRTTTYHPQTIGLTERLNKTIDNMMAMYVDVEHKTCDAILPYMTFANNMAAQETTQMTPYRLVYGRTPATMLNATLPNVSKDENINVTMYLQRTEEARQFARLRIHSQQKTASCQ